MYTLHRSLLKELLLAVLVVMVVSLIIFSVPAYRPVKTNITIDTWPEPLQGPADRGTFVVETFRKEHTITPKASYTIQGVVVDKHRYHALATNSFLSPYDVGIAWGLLADPARRTEIRFRNTNARSLLSFYQYASDGELIHEYTSNNHIIPANRNVSAGFGRLREEDVIRIDGYLVDVYTTGPMSYSDWETSTTRKDRGDGACEIVYVERLIIGDDVYA